MQFLQQTLSKLQVSPADFLNLNTTLSQSEQSLGKYREMGVELDIIQQKQWRHVDV